MNTAQIIELKAKLTSQLEQRLDGIDLEQAKQALDRVLTNKPAIASGAITAALTGGGFAAAYALFPRASSYALVFGAPIAAMWLMGKGAYQRKQASNDITEELKADLNQVINALLQESKP